MKKILLLAAAALMVTAASAQLKPAQKTTTMHPQLMQHPQNLLKEAQMREAGAPVAKAPKKAGTLEPIYQRPAGAFPGNMFVNPDGTLDGMAYACYIFMKPYAEYTFHGIAEGASDEVTFEWDVQQYAYNDAGQYVKQWITYAPGGCDLDVTYGWEVDSVPSMWVQDGGKWYNWYLRGHQMNGNKIAATYFSNIMAGPSADEIFSDVEEGGNVIVCSKNTSFGGLRGTEEYAFTYYSGIDPYGDNENGWWFGKNGGTSTNQQTGVVRTIRIDGIAQAYEKPTHPYLLRSVFLDCAVLEVTDQVDMTCKIYKLDEIPAYEEEDAVFLPEEPGELIATGRATLVPESEETLVKFTVYDEEDGLEVEYTPTIDYPILVVIDGYNDPERAALKDFSALIVSDDQTDEGFGELAYLKRGLNDEDGNFDGRYVYEGLNNFFSSGSMKTGLTIFLDIQNPFLTFSYSLEDGEFTFPDEGGLMRKVLYEEGTQQLVTESIEFFAYMPSVDEGWTLTCNGDDVPDWLSIELTDGEEDGEFNGNVNAKVVAEPLPAGVPYREAVVRFEFPGAYLDYTFKQGTEPDYNIFDVNRDHEVNIADVNYLINMILSGDQSSVGDVNLDHEVNIADVNALIDYILNH